jgi:PAS domain-containing protein
MSDSEEQGGAQESAGGSGRQRPEQEEKRYRALFENSPVGMWEEDFSRIKELIDELRAGGVEDLDAHLRAHPELVARCVGMIHVLDINQRAREFYGAA